MKVDSTKNQSFTGKIYTRKSAFWLGKRTSSIIKGLLEEEETIISKDAKKALIGLDKDLVIRGNIFTKKLIIQIFKEDKHFPPSLMKILFGKKETIKNSEATGNRLKNLIIKAKENLENPQEKTAKQTIDSINEKIADGKDGNLRKDKFQLQTIYIEKG